MIQITLEWLDLNSGFSFKQTDNSKGIVSLQKLDCQSTNHEIWEKLKAIFEKWNGSNKLIFILFSHFVLTEMLPSEHLNTPFSPGHTICCLWEFFIKWNPFPIFQIIFFYNTYNRCCIYQVRKFTESISKTLSTAFLWNEHANIGLWNDFSNCNKTGHWHIRICPHFTITHMVFR